MIDVQPGQKIIDLGCGNGQTLVLICQKYNLLGIGYESTLWGYWLTRVNIYRYRLGKQVHVLKKDFYQADISAADIVYLYLLPPVLKKLSPKLEKELKTGSRIISYAFPLPNWQPRQIISAPSNSKIKIFSYQFPVK